MYYLGKATEGQDDHAYPGEIVTQPLAERKPYRNAKVNKIYNEGYHVDHSPIDQATLYCHVQRSHRGDGGIHGTSGLHGL